ncbi:MAG: phosphatidate cytidylyltransferase [Spirochaetales bacterium]|nr:phosphatidate cytidylyltransferase [Spirochaetales bacterium]
MDKNLRGRLITVFVGVPFVLSLIFFVPQLNFIAFSLFVVLMSVLGSFEMSRLLFGKNTLISYLAPLLPLIQYLQGIFELNGQITDMAFVLLLLFSFALEIKLGESDDFKSSLERAAKNALLILYPGYFLSFILRLLALDGVNSFVLISYIILVFGNDISAYVWGRLFGKNNKGIVKVSPKKSVAGFVGSFFSTIGLSFACFALFAEHLPYASIAMRILLGVGVSITANIGDLIESVFKRSAGVKDSGNIFPGRGGALDSLDSEIASAPIFFLIFSMILEAAV